MVDNVMPEHPAGVPGQSCKDDNMNRTAFHATCKVVILC